MSRGPAIVLVTLAMMTAMAARARAQHCHVDLPDDEAAAGEHAHHGAGHHGHHGHHARPRPWWLGATSTLVVGSGSVAGEARDYQGAGVGVQGGWRRVSARAWLPAYRVAAEGVGVGDALVAVAADLVPGRGRARGGIAASISLPTGDSDAGRGMGHVMIAAGGWARVSAGRARLTGAVVWARAIGDGAEHSAHLHQATLWPLVDPMNPEELAVDASATAVLAPRLRAGVGATYAAALAAGGADRVVPYALAELGHGRYSVSTQLAVPVVGDPFVARGTLELAYRY